jgi:hypothetical protein
MIIRHLLLTSAAMLFCAASISAQLASTFVSASGSDSNACTQSAPCATFQAAYNKTAAGGLISALTPGNFGGVIIQQSMIIDGANMASITTSSNLANGNGLSVVSPSSTTAINVVIHGLVLNNNPASGNSNPIGVQADGAVNMTIENCLFNNFSKPVFIDGIGAKNVSIKNTTLVNGNYGVVISGGVGSSMQVSLQNVTIQGMSGDAVLATGGTTEIMNSFFTQNGTAVATDEYAAAGTTISVESSMISQNGIAVCSTPNGKIRLENNDIFDNGTGVAAGTCTGLVKTNGNNRDSGNTNGNPLPAANVSATALY